MKTAMVEKMVACREANKRKHKRNEDTRCGLKVEACTEGSKKRHKGKEDNRGGWKKRR